MNISESDIKKLLSEFNYDSNEKELNYFNQSYNRYVETLKLITSFIDEKSKIMDVGSGSGVLTIALKRIGYDISALDVTDEYIHIYDGEKIPFQKCDIEYENIKRSNYYDCILLLEVFEHINPSRIKIVLEKVHNMLNDGGTLIISTPNLTSIENRLFLLLGKEIISSKDHIREYTLNELKILLEKSNFVISKYFYSLSRDIYTHIIPDVLISKEHVLKNFIKYPFWKNVGRAIAYPLKLLIPSFRSTTFIMAEKDTLPLQDKIK